MYHTLSKDELLKLAELYRIEVIEDPNGHKVKDSQGARYIDSEDISEPFVNKVIEEKI